MKNKILVIWYKLSIHRCNVAIKFYSRLKSFFDKPPTIQNILLKLTGMLSIVAGTTVILKHHSDPISAGIMYICVGLLCLIAKYGSVERKG